MSIYRDITDRQATQLAQRIASWPIRKLTDAARDLIRYNYVEYTTKKVFTECIEEFDNETQLFHKEHWYPVKWMYGVIPTKQEWETASDNKVLVIEYRISPAISGRRIALISWRQGENNFILYKTEGG
jgi:hypothetical protein